MFNICIFFNSFTVLHYVKSIYLFKIMLLNLGCFPFKLLNIILEWHMDEDSNY